MVEAKKIKRTHYIVDKNIQFKYAGILLFYLSVFFLVAMTVIYFSGWKEMVEKMANVYPQARLAEILSAIYLRLLTGFLVLLLLAVVSAILVSHEIAGPLVRIKKALRQLTDNDYNLYLKLRKYDQLKDIADQINKLAETLKKKNV